MRVTHRWALINTLFLGGFNPHDLLAAWVLLNMESLNYLEERLAIDTKRFLRRILRSKDESRILIPVMDNFNGFLREILQEYSLAYFSLRPKILA